MLSSDDKLAWTKLIYNAQWQLRRAMDLNSKFQTLAQEQEENVTRCLVLNGMIPLGNGTDTIDNSTGTPSDTLEITIIRIDADGDETEIGKAVYNTITITDDFTITLKPYATGDDVIVTLTPGMMVTFSAESEIYINGHELNYISVSNA